MTTIARLTCALIAALSMTTAAVAQDAPAAAKSKEINFAEGDEIMGELAVANYMDVTSIGTFSVA